MRSLARTPQVIHLKAYRTFDCRQVLNVLLYISFFLRIVGLAGIIGQNKFGKNRKSRSQQTSLLG
jgi:hypothetical protein